MDEKGKLGKIIGLLILLAALPVAVFLVKQVADLASKAGGSLADITVETNVLVGNLPRPWRALAQGGEELTSFLDGLEDKVKALAPRYIRIDHIYDGFNIVGGTSGNLTFDWSRLDTLIDKIRRVGATPFLAMSYMPPAIATTDIVSSPRDWNDWSLVIQKTIEHYSGERKIPNVYYEVWNEPDLFGKMKVGNYIPLYRAAAYGAARAKGVLPFKLGGPATTGLYKNWVEKLLQVAEEEKLRLDFVSWHRYDTDPEVVLRDISDVESWIAARPYFSNIEVLTTEWGPYSDNNATYDANSGAAHLLTTVRWQLGRVNLGFLFSIKDGNDPKGQTYWGRWGLFTSDATGNKPKPRYMALNWLNQLGEDRVRISGEGSWVTGIPAKKGNTFQLILTNYDPRGIHSENVPVKFTGLIAQQYTYREKFLSGGGRTLSLNTTNGEVLQQVFMNANDVVFIELTAK